MTKNTEKLSFEERVGSQNNFESSIFLRVPIKKYIYSLIKCTGDMSYEDLYFNQIKPRINCMDDDALAKVIYKLNAYAYNYNLVENTYYIIYRLLVKPYEMEREV